MSYQGFVSSQAELDPALAAYSASPDQHNWTGQQPAFPSQDSAQFPTLSGYPQSNQPPIGGNAFGSAGLSGLGHSPGFEPNQYQLNQHAPHWPISNNLAINTTQPSYPDGPAPTASQPITLVPSPTAYRFDSGVFDWGQAKQRGGNGFIEMEDNYDYGTPSYVGSWGSSVSQNPDQPESILYSEPASFAQANKPSELKFVWDRQATLQPGTQLSTDNVTTLTGMQQYREPEGYDDFAGSQDGRSASPAPSAWATESVGLEHDHSSQPHDDSTMTTAAAFEQLMGPSRNASPARSPPAPPSQSDQFATLANPAWPSISSPALSPPIISAPSVTRASPALPQLTIPSGLEAPSLNLIQPTPASAAPRPPKGKGTLELERVLGMFTNQGDRVSSRLTIRSSLVGALTWRARHCLLSLLACVRAARLSPGRAGLGSPWARPLLELRRLRSSLLCTGGEGGFYSQLTDDPFFPPHLFSLFFLLSDPLSKWRRCTFRCPLRSTRSTLRPTSPASPRPCPTPRTPSRTPRS